MKTSSLLWLLSLASGAAFAAPPLSLGGVTPGMSEQTVLSRFGKPPNVERGSGFFARTLVYPGLRIDVDEDRVVVGARSTRPTACLGNGVCPGAAARTAYVRLPELRHSGQALSTGDGCWAEVPIAHGRVKAVALVCQP
jgi:hypothetical protein